MPRFLSCLPAMHSSTRISGPGNLNLASVILIYEGDQASGQRRSCGREEINWSGLAAMLNVKPNLLRCMYPQPLLGETMQCDLQDEVLRVLGVTSLALAHTIVQSNPLMYERGCTRWLPLRRRFVGKEIFGSSRGSFFHSPL